MLKYIVVLAGTLVVFAASDEVQARGLRRSRGSCPNGQCYASTPAAATNAVASNGDTDAAVPAAEVTTNVVASTNVARTSFRWTRGTRFFRRR